MKFKTMDELKEVLRKIINRKIYIPQYVLGKNKYAISHVGYSNEENKPVGGAVILFNLKNGEKYHHDEHIDIKDYGNPVVMLDFTTEEGIDDWIEWLKNLKRYMRGEI